MRQKTSFPAWVTRIALVLAALFVLAIIWDVDHWVQYLLTIIALVISAAISAAAE